MKGTDADRDYYRTAYREDRDPWSTMTDLDRVTRQWLQERGDAVPVPSALDLGCGKGRISRLLAEQGFEAVGLDYLSGALSRARSHEEQEPGTVRYVQADALKLPFGADRFGVLIDYGLLHHVRRRDGSRYRREVERVLAPGGLLFVSVFHVDDDHVERGDRDWVRHRGHYDRFFDPSGLRETLGENMTPVTHRVFRQDEHVCLHALFRRGGA